MLDENETSTTIEKNFGYYDIYDVRKRLKHVNPQVFNTDKNIISNKFEKFGKKGKISEEVFHLSVNDFYLTDPISKSSKTMISCSNEFKEKN